NPHGIVRGQPKPALLPTAAWINKPKDIAQTESALVDNSLITVVEQKNGYHNCPITNDQPPSKGLGRRETKPGDGPMLKILHREELRPSTGAAGGTAPPRSRVEALRHPT